MGIDYIGKAVPWRGSDRMEAEENGTGRWG